MIIFAPVQWDGLSVDHQLIDTAFCEAVRLTQLMRNKIEVEERYWGWAYPVPDTAKLVTKVKIDINVLYMFIKGELEDIREKKTEYVIDKNRLGAMITVMLRIHKSDHNMFKPCVSKDPRRQKPVGEFRDRRKAFYEDSIACLSVLGRLFATLYKEIDK